LPGDLRAPALKLLDYFLRSNKSNINQSKSVEKVEIAQQLYQDCHPDPLTGGLEIPASARPKEATSAPTAGLPPPMQLRRCSSADKRKTSGLNAQGPLHQFPDVRAAVLLDSEPGEFLYVTSTYAGQPNLELNETHPFEFRFYDHAYPLQTSSTARSRLGVNRPTGYMSLTSTNWVCGETLTSTLHIIARAEG